MKFCFIQLKKIEESIEFINSRPNPLAMYVFTKDEAFKRKILSETSSGSVTFNDILIHVCIALLFKHLLLPNIAKLILLCITMFCSTFVIHYHLEVLVRAALGGTMVSILLIHSAMKKQCCKEAFSQNWSQGILHGMVSSFSSSNYFTDLTTLASCSSCSG